MAYTGNISSSSPSYDDVMTYLHSVNISNDVMERVGQRLIVEYGNL